MKISLTSICSATGRFFKRWGLKIGLSGVYRLNQQREIHVQWILNCYKHLLRGLLNAIFLRRRSSTERKLLEDKSGPDKHFRKLPYTNRCTNFYEKNWITKILLVITGLFLLYYGVLYFLEVTNVKERVNPNAIWGYPHCAINDSMLYNYSRKYPCDFRPKPNPSGEVLVVTFVNSAWIPMAHNWICSAEKIGIKDSLYLVALESGVCSQVGSLGVPCYEDSHINVKHTVFAQPEYQKLVIERTKIILKFLSCWSKIILVDADITFLRNPLDYLRKVTEGKDIVFQADSTRVRFLDIFIPYFFNYICGGFIYMKSSFSTKQLWLSVLQYQTNYLWNDQAGLNICIRHHDQTVQWNVLNSEYFPNGQQYFTYRERSNKNMLVHANHLEGNEKMVHMIVSDIWCHNPSAIDSCSGSTYRNKCVSSRDATPLPNWCDRFVEVCREKYSVTVIQL